MYPGPSGLFGRAEYASVLNPATQGDGLDDVVEGCHREALVAKLNYGEPVGAAAISY